jgi:hypothetical protein
MTLTLAFSPKSWAEEIVPCSKIDAAKKITFATTDEFFMDSPIPLPVERVTLDFHSDFSQTKTGSIVRTPALRAGIGVSRDFQLYSNFPVVLNAPKHGENHYGYGDVGFGFKYRLIHETDNLPTVSFYPKLVFPSGDKQKGLSNGTWAGRFPLWLQKKWGNWSVTTGGGVYINPAKNKRNYPLGGLLVQYQITKYFMLGNEFYGEGKKGPSEKARLNFNFGGSYFFNSSYFLAFSAGHSLAGPQRFTSFLGFGIAWGPVTNP